MKLFCQFCLAMLLLFSFISPVNANDTAGKTGDAIQVLLPLAACGLTFRYHDGEGRNQFYKAFFSSMALSYVLKFSIDDNRPNGSKSEVAFVSAHTSAAFSGAAFIQRRYGWKFGAPAYALAAYVGWSRIHVHAHDYDDVLRGAAIGIAGAYYFARPISKHVMLYPIVGAHTMGIGISANW
ncbi:MAG: phosphatase PAP2 family protein [Acidobacteria bacterium]|nr:phosphatase PAP2 family protein [Acidobacteriota bacterium]